MTQMTIARLITEHGLLHRVQHKFKKACKGERALRNYALVGKDLDRYLSLHQEYQVANYEMVWGLVMMLKYQQFIAEWAPESHSPRKELAQKELSCLNVIVSIMRMRHSLQKSEVYRKEV